MVDKEGTEGEAEAERAYKAAHEVQDEEEEDIAQVSSALIDKVR